MLPNLLDDLLKAWDSKAAAAPAPPQESPAEEAGPPVVEVADAISSLDTAAAAVQHEEPPPPIDTGNTAPAAPMPTPMDDLLSSLLASFEEIPEPLHAAAAPEPPPQPEPVAEVPDNTPLPPPPPVRERETLAPLAAPQPAPAQTRKFVAVGFGRHKLAFSIDSVVEAGRYPRTTFVPGLPAHIRGVFAFRGSVLPVVDTRLLTGAPERFLPHECRVLTLQSGNAKAAFIFDTLEGIVNLDPGNATPVQPDTEPNLPMPGVLTGLNAEDGLGQRFGIADATRLLDLAGCLAAAGSVAAGSEKESA